MERLTGVGESPVREIRVFFMKRIPEYGEARETLSEAGSTTIQG